MHEASTSSSAGDLHQLSALRLQWCASFPCRTRHTRREYPQDLLRRAFFCFHRLITAGTSNDRRLIHSILHNPSPHPQFLSAPLSWRNACRTLSFRVFRSSRVLFHFERPPGASRSCVAIATLSRFLNSATLRGGLLGRMTNACNEWGLMMMIGSLILSEQTTAIKEVFASSDVLTLVAKHLGVSIGRVTDEAHFTNDLGADWLDRLELMMAIEDQFARVEITDDDVDRIEVVGDLIRLIE